MYQHNILGQENPGVEIRLVGAMFFEVPQTQPVHYRPIGVHVTPQGLHALQTVTEGGSVLNEAALRDVARQLISPSDTSRGIIGIQGGWNSSRCSVFLNFEIKSANMVINEVLSAYTTTPAITATSIDPSIVIIPNSVVRIGQSYSHGAHGNRASFNVSQNSHVLTPISIQTHTGTVNGEHSLRPADALTGWGNVVSNLNPNGYDPRCALNQANGVAADRIVNAMPSKYLSKTLNAWATAQQSSEKQLMSNDSFVIGTAASSAREQDFKASQLFNLIENRTSFSQSGAFTWAEICGAVLEVNAQGVRTAPLQPGAPSAANMQNWGANSEAVKVGHALTQAVPSVVSQGLGVQYNFKAYRDPIQGHVLVPAHFQAMFPEQQNDVAFMNSIGAAIQNVVLPEVITPEIGEYVIDCQYTVGGDMYMNISINGQPAEPLIMPCYCDSLSSMAIVGSREEVNQAGVAIGQLIENTFVGPDNGMAQQAPGAAGGQLYV
ncbi:hypothetical protein SM033_00219 [Vibrio phage vB_VpaM_sm033]|nr:hypothetical protein SM033_00219 [Vibrio phage vB_VpaM_sm033]